MTNDDLCYLSATDALKLFRKRKLSPVELTKALIARSEKVNPKINCLADRYFDEALVQAKASEARYMKRGGKTAALDGVPLAVKDAQPTFRGRTVGPSRKPARRRRYAGRARSTVYPARWRQMGRD